MKTVYCCLAAVVGFAAVAFAADLPQWDFEQDAGGWLTMDKQASLTLTTEPAHVQQGKGALQFSFKAHPAEGDDIPGVLLVPVPGLAGGACLHLAIQTSVSGPVFFVLRETDESNYMLFEYVTAGDWHVLDLPLASFRLDENSKDENAKLDPEQIGGIGIADPGHFLAQAVAQANVPFFYERPAARDLWLDDVKVLAECPKRLSAAQMPGTTMIEDCDSDSAYFMVFGGRNLKVATCSDPAVRGNSLRLDYELPSQTIVAAMVQLPLGALQGARGLSFSVRVGAACPLLVTVEEEDRSRYQKLIDLNAGHWETPILTWADMTLAEDSQDPDEGLQPEQIRNIGFIDAATVVGQKETANTLWLDEITTAP